MSEFTQAELEAYLDEALLPDDMARIEAELRQNASLMQRLVAIHGRRDAGVHSLGEVWRRHRISCPDRETWGSFLLGILDPGFHAYLEFHVRTIGCRLCQANLDDLSAQHRSQAQSTQRQQRYFQSSAGLLPRR